MAEAGLAAIRDGYGEALVALGEKDARVVAVCADLTESTRTQAFRDRWPERFIQVGVAEQNLVTVAAGLAAAGKIPFATSYATFSPGRNWEQIRTTICYNDLPVKIIGSHAGLSVGPDGATHQALEDIALMRALPNMVVLVPADAHEARRATIAAASHPGPVYIRLAREKTSVVTLPDGPFEIGKAYQLREGHDVAILACGPLVSEALDAANILEAKGISACVMNVPTVKPLDEEAVLRVARKTGAIVTVEEHQVAGGLGGAVAELLSTRLPTRQVFVGIRDQFGESGQPRELWQKHQLVAEDIARAAVQSRKQADAER